MKTGSEPTTLSPRPPNHPTRTKLEPTILAEPAITAIGFDADDTLWQNEHFYRLTEARFVELLAGHVDADRVASSLLAAETRNLKFYGFGIKGFTLSMIETAIELTDQRVPIAVISQILEIGRELLGHPVETLPFARETLEQLKNGHRLILITKGDLFDQERKLAASGLGGLFDAVEIVSDKTSATYARIFNRHGDGPVRAAMIGNSLKSDIVPAIKAGAYGIYVPHALTWSFERVEPPRDAPRFREIADLGQLPALIRQLES